MPGQLARAVQVEDAGEDGIRVGVLAARNDRRHAGADGTVADLELALAADDRALADRDAGHVRDRIERSGSALERNPQVARARLDGLGERRQRRSGRGPPWRTRSASCVSISCGGVYPQASVVDRTRDHGGHPGLRPHRAQSRPHPPRASPTPPRGDPRHRGARISRLPAEVRHDPGPLPGTRPRRRRTPDRGRSADSRPAGQGPADAMPWGDLGVDTVLESTSRARTRAELEAHLANGARRVIVCGATTEPADLLAVGGLTEGRLEPGQRIVSIGSPTVQCAAPALRDPAGRVRDTPRRRRPTIHSYTSAHHLADAPADDHAAWPRGGREHHPAGFALGRDAGRSCSRSSRGRLSAYALNVPAYNGSVVDLVCWHEKDVTADDVRAVFRGAVAQRRWAGTVEVTEDPIVSSDVSRSDASCVFDSLATMALPGRVTKTLLWFDAGYLLRAARDRRGRAVRRRGGRGVTAPAAPPRGSGSTASGASAAPSSASRWSGRTWRSSRSTISTTTTQLAYLLRYDTVMGLLEGEIESGPAALGSDGRTIATTKERSPAKIPWARPRGRRRRRSDRRLPHARVARAASGGRRATASS